METSTTIEFSPSAYQDLVLDKGTHEVRQKCGRAVRINEIDPRKFIYPVRGEYEVSPGQWNQDVWKEDGDFDEDDAQLNLVIVPLPVTSPVTPFQQQLLDTVLCANPTHKVETACEFPVEIWTVTAKHSDGAYPINGELRERNGKLYRESWTADGHFQGDGSTSRYDLRIVPIEPETPLTRYVLQYGAPGGLVHFKTVEARSVEEATALLETYCSPTSTVWLTDVTPL